jgi:hypothetical protein
VFLWKFFEAASGKEFIPHYQFKDGIGVGDCVGQSTAAAVDMLMATEIVLHKEPEVWVAKASIEAIYGGGRVEMGTDYGSDPHGLATDDAIEYIKKYGILHRIDYPDQGYDLSEYEIPRSLKWATAGVPDILEPLAKEHPVQQYSKVANFDELSDALAAGQPVVIGSSYATKDTRDAEGFGELYTSGGQTYRRGRFFNLPRKKWAHCQVFVGIRNATDRPGALLLNSHGPDWITGGKSFGMPDGSCWLTPEHCNLTIKDWGEAFAISSYVGHPGDRIERIKNHKLF